MAANPWAPIEQCRRHLIQGSVEYSTNTNNTNATCLYSLATILVSPSTTPFCSWDLVRQPHSGCHGYRDSRVTIQHCLCVILRICCLATMEEKWQSMLANTAPLDGITALLRQSLDCAWRQRLVSMLHRFPWRGVWVLWVPALRRESSSLHVCTYL